MYKSGVFWLQIFTTVVLCQYRYACFFSVISIGGGGRVSTDTYTLDEKLNVKSQVFPLSPSCALTLFKVFSGE